MLPGMDGFEVTKKIRNNPGFSDIFILMLTAKTDTIDKVVGFELGADDYVEKPFSPRELILRVKAILKRGADKKEEKPSLLKYKGIEVDENKHKVLFP